ncbi:MAG TPA: DUF1287 domain-containing protein [Polyangia bacterium]
MGDRRVVGLLVVAVAAALAAAACGEGGSATMRPGEDCLRCHGAGGEQAFSAAGTVYRADGTAAVGVTVTLTDADARQAAQVTNSVGNFHFTEALTAPLQVELSEGASTASMDLQALVHEDLRRRLRAYPWVTRPDTNIDHRRVKNLRVLMEQQFRARPPALAAAARGDWLPGDVVLLDTFPSKPGPDHIGILSDRLGESGWPLVINNWTVGARTTEMDLLPGIPVTHRFRVPGAAAK